MPIKSMHKNQQNVPFIYHIGYLFNLLAMSIHTCCFFSLTNFVPPLFNKTSIFSSVRCKIMCSSARVNGTARLVPFMDISGLKHTCLVLSCLLSSSFRISMH